MTGVSIEPGSRRRAVVIALVAFKTIIAAGNPASSPRSPYRDAEASTSPGEPAPGQDRSRVRSGPHRSQHWYVQFQNARQRCHRKFPAAVRPFKRLAPASAFLGKRRILMAPDLTELPSGVSRRPGSTSRGLRRRCTGLHRLAVRRCCPGREFSTVVPGPCRRCCRQCVR